MTNKREILVTSALPYANGPIHIGHLLEYIQTDIWARFQRLIGNDCYYVCADDAHGTPVMLKAQAAGIEPEQLITEMHAAHLRDFKAFHIEFDNYHSTHSEENRQISNQIYQCAKEKGYIEKRKIQQAYDKTAKMFLPDRYIRGECPRCGATDQYGDCCEVCGSTYNASELINPISVISGDKPVLRESEHYFFKLHMLEEHLKSWLSSGCVPPGIRNKLDEWFASGLQDWDISRDAPYFGFEIPDHPDKYFYVWLDAPIGYIASFKNYCDSKRLDYKYFLHADSDTELHHFIGKDIAYFHTLFWPALLHSADLRLPTRVYSHGFLTVNGAKMSKSRGTFIKAETYTKHLNPEYLRYYFAAKLGSGLDDIDLNIEDFVQRVNSDLVGKVVNIAGRCASFISKHFANRIICSQQLFKHPCYQQFKEAETEIRDSYEKTEYATAMRLIMSLADEANRLIDRHKPWAIAKHDGASAELHEICSLGILLFSRLCLYLKPVLPIMTEAAEKFLNISVSHWDDNSFAGKDRHTIATFKPLMSRVELKKVKAMIADEAIAQQREKASTSKTETAPLSVAQTISLSAFQKVDLRTARIISAKEIDGADKLLELSVDLGENTTRTIIAGIKNAYNSSELVGKLVVVVANLEPKKMRFGTSHGMVLAAGDGARLFLLSPDDGAEAGLKIK
ncbi:MAG: methionine--tRNA ligase [Chromatiales bacterium]|nr:methionine--tRNA ligase [Chromatiales bacterium]